MLYYDLAAMKSALILIALLPTTVFAKDKIANLEWKHGTLVEQSADESHCRTLGHVQDGGGSVNTICVTLTRYTIDAGDFVYIGERDLRLRSDKHLDITVNGPIEYAIRGRTLFLKDDSGKPHTLELVQKSAKTASR